MIPTFIGDSRVANVVDDVPQGLSRRRAAPG